MPGSSELIAPVKGTGTKSDATYICLAEAPATSGLISGCAGWAWGAMASPFASSGSIDCCEISFLGVGDGCPFERKPTVHEKTSNTAAAAPTLAHSRDLRHAA